MTYRTGVDGGDGADTVESLWPTVSEAPLHELDEPALPESETENPTDEPEAAPEPAPWTASDEWDDLRQVLAGEDQPAMVVDENDDEDDDEDDADDEPDADDEVAELAERVDQLAFELREERAARERLSDQLDRLAEELDAVLGEALATERQGREQLEETLRQVQATITDTSAPAFEGPERRTGEDRRSVAERRRGLPPRPLRARSRRGSDEADERGPEPADEPADEPVFEAEVEEQPSVWKSRLGDVAGSVSAWSSDDIDRLRVD